MLRAFLLAAALAAAGLPAGAIDLRLFTLGSGEVGGGYFAAANAICESLNRERRGVLRCSPEATPGSIYNLAALRDRQLDFALVQSDWQRYAYEGTESFAAAGPMTDMRSVMSLYPEAITVLASRSSGIAQIADLPGKRVDVGHPASGRRATVMQLLDALGLGTADFAAIREFPAGVAIDELCAGRVDATILIMGHPNPAVEHALERCAAVLVPLRGHEVEALLGAGRDYVPYVIAGALYPGLAADVPTYAVIATLVTRADLAADIVQALVGETLADLPELPLRAPVLAGLDPAEMRERGLTAPLHPGAQAAFEAHTTEP